MSGELLVTGASSQLGFCLLARARAADRRVTAISRHRPGWAAGESPGPAWRSADLARGWPIEARGEELVHAAPLELLPPLLPAARDAGVRRLVAFSSTSVLVKRHSADPAERFLAHRLAQAEDAVLAASRAAGLRCVIFRPTLIYGVGLDRNLTTMAGFIRRWRFLPLPAPASGMRQPVHADDLAALALDTVASIPRSGAIYKLGGGTTLSYREMVERVFAGLGLRPRVVPLPAVLCRAGVSLLRLAPSHAQLRPVLLDRLERDLVFDDGAARRELGWDPRPFAPVAEHFRPPASP